MLLTSLPDAVRKLDPRVMVHNPVMFVVEVGAVLSTVLAVIDPSRVRAGRSSSGCGSPSCSPTWPRRWPRAAARRRPPPCGGPRPRPSRAGCRADGTEEDVPGDRSSRLGDRVVVEAGEVIPGDGDVVEGVASVDESAITGESAPVIRESGGDRSSVTGGTKVLSDRIVVADHRQARRELHRPDDRPGRGRVAAEDAQRDRAEHPAGQPDDRLPAGHRDAAAVRRSTPAPSSR